MKITEYWDDLQSAEHSANIRLQNQKKGNSPNIVQNIQIGSAVPLPILKRAEWNTLGGAGEGINSKVFHLV